MIGVDTSTLVAFSAGLKGADVDEVIRGFKSRLIVLPPTVLSEMLSDSKLSSSIETQLLRLPVLEIQAGFWERVGRFRKFFLSRGLKCRLADAQIAQSCIDANVPLISRDKDFKKYVGHFDFRLIGF